MGLTNYRLYTIHKFNFQQRAARIIIIIILFYFLGETGMEDW